TGSRTLSASLGLISEGHGVKTGGVDVGGGVRRLPAWRRRQFQVLGEPSCLISGTLPDPFRTPHTRRGLRLRVLRLPLARTE
ncbi:hypothetical protein BaRGS_00021900, partial [Batillaria attramentaria]